jgi:hypothetical protein
VSWHFHNASETSSRALSVVATSAHTGGLRGEVLDIVESP